jgi:hypothetical protein
MSFSINLLYCSYSLIGLSFVISSPSSISKSYYFQPGFFLRPHASLLYFHLLLSFVFLYSFMIESNGFVERYCLYSIHYDPFFYFISLKFLTLHSNWCKSYYCHDFMDYFETGAVWIFVRYSFFRAGMFIFGFSTLIIRY